MSSDSQRCHQDARFTCNICFEAVVEPVVPRCGHLFCWPCLYRWLEPGMQADERVSLGLMPSDSVNRSRRMCPVCKSPCSTFSLVPIFVRADDAIKENSLEREVGRLENLSSNIPTQNRSLTSDAAHSDNRESDETVSSSISDGVGLGLRRRVPSRPPASSPAPQSPNHDSRRNNSVVMTQSPNSHRASLSHGIMLTFQQATSSSVPRLHRRVGDVAELDAHPNATEYLSRLLIMLTSFVILCLLLL